MLLKGTGNQPNVNPVFGLNQENPAQILNRITKTLLCKSIYGIRGLIKLFRQYDRNGDCRLDRQEI